MPGARIAVDGNVTAGHSYVDESMLTGETAAVPKSPGDSLMGGTLNTGGTLHMRCERVRALPLYTELRRRGFPTYFCSPQPKSGCAQPTGFSDVPWRARSGEPMAWSCAGGG